MLTADDVQSHVPGERYFGVDYDEKTTTDFEGFASVPVTVAPNAVLLRCLLRMKSFFLCCQLVTHIVCIGVHSR